MSISEFDQFSDEYHQSLSQSIQFSGESPEYFHQYKVGDVLRSVPAATIRRILDFGTGVGNSVPHLRLAYPDAELIAVDISARSLAVARERFPDAADFRQIDSPPLALPDAAFDVVFTACVFHHIPWPEHEAILKDLLRLLAPGGRLFVFEHNPWNPLTQYVVNTCPFDRNARLIPAPTLRRQVLRAGFSDVSVRYRVFFPHRLAWLRHWEHGLSAVPLGAQYAIEARRESP